MANEDLVWLTRRVFGGHCGSHYCISAVYLGLICAGLGRPVEERVSVQKLKASLWLAEKYPLTLHDQLLPIVDLLVSQIVLV